MQAMAAQSCFVSLSFCSRHAMYAYYLMKRAVYMRNATQAWTTLLRGGDLVMLPQALCMYNTCIQDIAK